MNLKSDIDKSMGMMFGLAIGDALGNPLMVSLMLPWKGKDNVGWEGPKIYSQFYS
jgi:hypothetical protein